MIDLNFVDHLPEVFFELNALSLAEIFSGPTLYYAHGPETDPMFISCLLHGNEHSGFNAVQSMLKKIQSGQLRQKRPLYILFGNILGANKNKRHLESQPDFNRIWQDQTIPLVAEITKLVNSRPFFAGIDIHNNTGHNPHYGCISDLNATNLQLATLFSRNIVYFTYPSTTCSILMTNYMPAITLECGISSEKRGEEHALEFLDACLRLDHIPELKPNPQDYNLYQTIASLHIDPSTRVGFEQELDPGLVYDIEFRSDLDQLNFKPQPKGTEFAKVNHPHRTPELRYISPDVPKIPLFQCSGQSWVCDAEVIPSMLTRDIQIMKDDCLGYIMRRL